MTTQDRLPFSPTGEYVARKSFRFAGRDFTPGDDFPWRQLACSARRLRQLYEGRFIVMASDEEEATSSAPASPPSDPVVPEVTEETTGAEDDEESEEDDDSEEEEESEEEEGFVFDPEIHKVENPNRGEWVITRGGKTVLTVTRKEARRLSKKVKPTAVRPEETVE